MYEHNYNKDDCKRIKQGLNRIGICPIHQENIHTMEKRLHNNHICMGCVFYMQTT